MTDPTRTHRPMSRRPAPRSASRSSTRPASARRAGRGDAGRAGRGGGEGGRVPRRAAAGAGRVRELPPPDPRGARARPRPRGRGPHPQGAGARGRLRPGDRHAPRGPGGRRLGRGDRGHRSQAAALLESEGVTPSRRRPGTRSTPASTRRSSTVPGDRAPRGRDRRRAAPRVPAAGPPHPARDGRGRGAGGDADAIRPDRARPTAGTHPDYSHPHDSRRAHRHGQDHRHRPRHDQLRRRRHGGRRAHRHPLVRGQPHRPVGRGLRQDRRAGRRPAGQAPGGHESRATRSTRSSASWAAAGTTPRSSARKGLVPYTVEKDPKSDGIAGRGRRRPATRRPRSARWSSRS